MWIFAISELRSDIEAALDEYHRIMKQVGDANAELTRLGAAVSEMSGRSKAHEDYLAALGK
jgi:hypothetical protein